MRDATERRAMATAMTHRERVLLAANREQADRVPLDLGGTHASSITVASYNRLKTHLGVAGPMSYLSRRSCVALPHEEVLERFDIDTRIVVPPVAEEPPTMEDGSDAYVDEWGVERKKLPDGHYYVSRPALPEGSTVADLERHRWPDPEDPAHYGSLRPEASRLRRETDCALLMYLPARIMSLGQFLRGFDVWLMDLYANQGFAEALLERGTEIQLQMIRRILEQAGELVDIVNVADDLGMQTGPLFSADLYRQMIKPWQQKLYGFIRAHTAAKLMLHTCGSVYELIPDLIDVGVEILNPIQVSARGMDPARLKAEFGNDLCFWGGVDTHRVLPFGSTDEVRAEVKRRISELGSGGGYVLGAVHNIQPEVPPENLCAMFDTALEFGRYDA